MTGPLLTELNDNRLLIARLILLFLLRLYNDNSSFTITAGSIGHAFDGQGIGSINAKNGAEVAVDYYKAMTINVDATSTFVGTEVQ